MVLPNFKTLNCSKCNVLVGMTEASYKRFLSIKNIKPICNECFWEVDYGKVKLKILNKNQMDEIKQYIPDLTDEKMKKTLADIERIKLKWKLTKLPMM